LRFISNFETAIPLITLSPSGYSDHGNVANIYELAEATMSNKATPQNGPSKTGNPSGTGRGNNPPRGK